MNKKLLCKSVVMATATLGAVCTMPTFAQEGRNILLEEIVVTARRRDERLQDVPISVAVFTQDQLDNRNILSAVDLALNTPGMEANTRFGGDFATFAIRGFSQELRTTASVGVYFAEVVAPRGANTTTSGDGAGPGDLFDLENVQVLKGPQGTLFGRNTTGGAVLIVPRKPTDELEGYIEGSMGNFDMARAQGVLNVPISDRVRARVGFDYQRRDGYIKNLADVGPRDFADVDYIAGRGSLVVDITDSLENYTIFKIVASDNNGAPGQSFVCNPNAGGIASFFIQPCFNMLASHPEASKFHRTFNTLPGAKNELDQWQVINTTTWEMSESLTIKNIFSFASLEGKNSNSVFGTQLPFSIPPFPGIIPGVPPGGLGTQEIIAANSGVSPDFLTTDQETLVEEIQIQGVHFDERLTWQAGLYYERSETDGRHGARSQNNLSCDMSTIDGDPSEFRCNDLLAAFLPFDVWGVINSQPNSISYQSKAIYGQATYEITDEWSVTGGLRYTVDTTSGRIESTFYRFPSNPFTGGYFPVSFAQFTSSRPRTRSEEPTWVIGAEYKPTDDMMLYAKYARGYRQGAINIAAPEGLQTYDPETVDTYEIGLKSTFGGSLPGNFNIAAFYNDFTDQAIQVGLLPPGEPGTTTIVNIGESTIWGIEIDAAVQLFDGFVLSGAYTYLDTKVDDFVDPLTDPRFDDFRAIGGVVSSANAVQGDPLPFSPKHSLTLSANYQLPIDPALGEVHVGINYIYTDKIQTVSPSFSPFGVLPSYELVNFNLNWNQVGGGPVDASIFVTNLFDEKFVNFVSGNWASFGFETRYVGPPRMYGARLRYNF